MEKCDEDVYKHAIAITGGIATGKSTVAKLLRQKGYIVIDADYLSKQAVEPGSLGLREIINVFGSDVTLPDGSLDRKKMRSIIFGSNEKKLALEQIIHPRLAELTNNELVKSGYAKESNQPWFYEAALIFEKKRERDFYSIWVCYCPDSVQLKRLTQRDKISISEAKAIISHQMPIEEKIKKANISIDTNCSFEELEKKILEALQSIKRN